MNKKVIRILFILILCVITIPFSVNAATYKIKLDDNGGKGGSGTIYAKGTNPNNTTFQVNSVKVPTKKNVRFLGYYYKNELYIDSSGRIVNKTWKEGIDAKFYAVWSFSTDESWIDRTPREPYKGEYDESGDNGYDPFSTGYGIYVKLVQYKNGTEKEIGLPLLIYNNALLQDISRSKPGDSSDETVTRGTTYCYDVGTGYCGKMKEKYPYMVIIDSSTADQGFKYAMSVVNNADIDLVEKDYSCGDENGCGFIANTDAAVTEQGFQGTVHCQKYNFHVDIQNIFYYLQSDIIFSTSSGNISYSEFKKRLIPASDYNVKLKSISDLYALIKGCFINGECSDDNSKKLAARIGLTRDGTLSSSKLSSLFGVTIDQKELDTYYLSFEPVVRVPGSSPYKSESTPITKRSSVGEETWNYYCNNNNDHGYCLDTTVSDKMNPADVEGKCYDNTKHDGYCTNSSYSTYNKCTAAGADWIASYYTYCDKKSKKMWKLSNPACHSYLNINYHTLITNRYWYKSTIMPARKSSRGTAALLSHLTTSKVDDPDVKHPNEAVRDLWEYYVGPELETALVGECGSVSVSNSKCSSTVKNKYSMVGTVNDLDYTKESAKTTAIGVLYVWIPEIIDSCVDCKGKTGDSLLSCAENYCDNLYYYEEGSTLATQKLKANCIKNTCGYKKQQQNCESKLNDSAFIESIMTDGSSSIGSTGSSFTSICNDSGGITNDNNKGYKAYCVMSSKTDNNEDNVILDKLYFTNVMCVESTSCGFSDLSDDRITKGRRIDYNTKTHVVKNCKVWFDVDSWKFYYASLPNGDTIWVDANGNESVEASELHNTRDRMIEIIEDYNKSVRTGFNGSISNNIVIEGSTVKWEDLNYDISNLNVRVRIDENYIGGSNQEEHELVVDEDTIEDEKHNVTDSTSNETMLKLEAYSFAREVKVSRNTNTFSSSSSYDSTYELPKMYCLTEDKDATPLESANETCPDGTLAVHSYFLNLHSTGARFVGSCTNSVTISGTTTAAYFKSQDTCSPSEKPSCTITVRENTGTKYHCGQYVGSEGVTVKLSTHFQNTIDVQIKGWGLSKSGYVTNGEQDAIELGPGKVTYYGKMELTDGRVATCTKTFEVNNCIDNGCVIHKDGTYNGSGTSRFYITPEEEGATYFAKTERASSYFERLGKEGGYHTFYVPVKEDGEDEKIVGKIVKGGTCRYCCTSTPIETSTGCEVDLKKVKKTCETEYNEDPRFDSYDECVDYYNCSCPGPTISTDLSKLSSWCESNATKPEIGFPSANVCVSTCCLDPEKCLASDNITYRPVSRENPFPNSIISKDLGYPEGDRLVGRNWVGLHENITTTESGASSVYDEVEYDIVLKPNDIRKIRNYNETHSYYEYKDARDLDTSDKSIYEKDISSCRDGDYLGYCSDFIRSNEGCSIKGSNNKCFLVIRGITVNKEGD